MRTADTGMYDNRVRFAVRRMAGLLGGCVFIAGGIVALLDDRGSPITAGFFFFFGILIGAIPLLFRVGNKEPSTEVIDDEYGAFLPIQAGMNAQLFVRSEERRVGKESRSRRWAADSNKQICTSQRTI